MASAETFSRISGINEAPSAERSLAPISLSPGENRPARSPLTTILPSRAKSDSAFDRKYRCRLTEIAAR